jgi:hypothetical protein
MKYPVDDLYPRVQFLINISGPRRVTSRFGKADLTVTASPILIALHRFPRLHSTLVATRVFNSTIKSFACWFTDVTVPVMINVLRPGVEKKASYASIVRPGPNLGGGQAHLGRRWQFPQRPARGLTDEQEAQAPGNGSTSSFLGKKIELRFTPFIPQGKARTLFIHILTSAMWFCSVP